MHRPQPPIFTPQICFPSISVRDKCPSSCSGRMPLSPLICSPSPKSGFQPITLSPSQPFHPAQPALCVNLCHLMTFALDPNQCPACPVHSLYSSPSGHSFIQQILNIRHYFRCCHVDKHNTVISPQIPGSFHPRSSNDCILLRGKSGLLPWSSRPHSWASSSCLITLIARHMGSRPQSHLSSNLPGTLSSHLLFP